MLKLVFSHRNIEALRKAGFNDLASYVEEQIGPETGKKSVCLSVMGMKNEEKNNKNQKSTE